jgi:two-component system, NarL family, nitrate/nitrite response regulator NarL
MTQKGASSFLHHQSGPPQGMSRSDDPRHVADDISIRVLIGDASRMASQLIAGQLRSSRSPRFETILPGCFDSKAIVDEIVRTRPDGALVSGVLQDSSFAGYSVLRTIQPLNLATRLILLLEDCEHDLVIDAFRSGARGVFSRAESSERLSKCIDTVHKGQIWASTREMDHIIEELMATRPRWIVDAHGSSLLSKREEEVVALVADGLTNRQISGQLKLSEHTVQELSVQGFRETGDLEPGRTRALRLVPKSQERPCNRPPAHAATDRRQSATLPFGADWDLSQHRGCRRSGTPRRTEFRR